MPVIHALKSEHIDYCLRNYLKDDRKFSQIGFGTFPTSGSNNSINRLNVNALMLLKQLIKSLDENGIKMHTFGISTPPAIYLLSLVGVHSFDSNGWMRSGGYGLVFLPYTRGYLVTFNSRRQESLNENEFQKWKEVVDHCCPFCDSFRELSENRWFRILHNLTVMAELETHHREPKLEVMETLSKDYYRILQNLKLN
jgi:queuine/archaeosine tRNA-ribosyltransferase